LTAIPGNSVVNLSWTPVPGATNYNVKRSTNGATYTIIATNLVALNFTNTSLANGTTYYFSVSATNAAGESAHSTPAVAQPVSMTSPQINFAIGGGQMQFAWPLDHRGWTLQTQTNPPGSGLGTNWMNLPGSESTNQVMLPVNPNAGSVFLRLVYP
jgi:cellulose 1,4-beta-cellobiosidase